MLPHAASARAHRARTGSTGLQQDDLVGAQLAEPGSNDTVDTARLNESLSLEECIRRRQRQETMHSTPLVCRNPEPSRRPRASLPMSGRQHLKKAAYEFELDNPHRRHGEDSRRVRAHRWAYCTGRQKYEYRNEGDEEGQYQPLMIHRPRQQKKNNLIGVFQIHQWRREQHGGFLFLLLAHMCNKQHRQQFSLSLHKHSN